MPLRCYSSCRRQLPIPSVMILMSLHQDDQEIFYAASDFDPEDSSAPSPTTCENDGDDRSSFTLSAANIARVLLPLLLPGPAPTPSDPFFVLPMESTLIQSLTHRSMTTTSIIGQQLDDAMILQIWISPTSRSPWFLPNLLERFPIPWHSCYCSTVFLSFQRWRRFDSLESQHLFTPPLDAMIQVQPAFEDI